VSLNLKDGLKKKVEDPWAGTRSALLILIFAVIALVTLTTLRSNQAFLEVSQQTATALGNRTITPTPLNPEEINSIPPVVDTNVLVLLGGLILILVLVVMLREVAWFRKHSQ
jgi:ABC-type Fe3+-hydroxamate transport system substrate-binding protein